MGFKRDVLHAPVQRSTPAELRTAIAGKRFLMVGGTKGIGFAATKLLVKYNGLVTVVGRAMQEPLDDVTFKRADLSTVKGCMELANELKSSKFDTVLFTQGVVTRKELTRTQDGIEEDLQISYLSRFILLNRFVKDGVLEGGQKRVFVMGYPGNDTKATSLEDINFDRTPYKQFPAHMNTVVFNEMLVKEAARRFPDLHIFGVNPGLIQTGIRDAFHGGKAAWLGYAIESVIALFTVSAEQYAEKSLIPILASPQLSQPPSALMFAPNLDAVLSQGDAANETAHEKVWNASLQLVEKAGAQL
jgi:NAD(P)-dependent dehydrogenase (short-subunit alcohol dehydrogenase family)